MLSYLIITARTPLHNLDQSQPRRHLRRCALCQVLVRNPPNDQQRYFEAFFPQSGIALKHGQALRRDLIPADSFDNFRSAANSSLEKGVRRTTSRSNSGCLLLVQLSFSATTLAITCCSMIGTNGSSWNVARLSSGCEFRSLFRNGSTVTIR